MLVMLVRHAQAGELDPERWPDDRLRPLTNPGRAAHARVSRALARLDLEPALVLSSPWVRAMQTAEIMIEELGLDSDQVGCEALTVEPNLQAFQECLADVDPDASVALVGHSPFLEDLASVLVTGAPSRMAIDFPKSGVMGIEMDRVDAGAGTLRFFLRPKQMERFRRRKR
ncbi:MAG: histidine phosphatase family protein [Gemmatimonadales bacterium]|nr:histidine phosphatase family protein [Gemmatimonadales bacterium]